MTTIRHLAVIILALAIAPLAEAQPSAPRAQGERLTSAESYVPLSSLLTSVTVGGRGRGQLLVDFGLDVPDAALRARVQAIGPRLRDALRSALSDYVLSRYRVGGAPDPEQIARMLQLATDRLLGRPGARVLLINVMYQGPMG